MRGLRLWFRRLLVGGAIAFLLPSIYTARATFYSEAKTTTDLSSLSSGGLGGLGALMALAGGSGAAVQAGFFLDLLKSQDFFDSLAASTLPIGPNGTPITVKSYVVKRSKNDADLRWKARIALKKMVDVDIDRLTQVVVNLSLDHHQPARHDTIPVNSPRTGRAINASAAARALLPS